MQSFLDQTMKKLENVPMEAKEALVLMIKNLDAINEMLKGKPLPKEVMDPMIIQAKDHKEYFWLLILFYKSCMDEGLQEGSQVESDNMF